MPETLTAAEIAQIARFDHFRPIRAGDNAKMVRSLAKRGYLDVLRCVALYRLSDLGREALRL